MIRWPLALVGGGVYSSIYSAYGCIGVCTLKYNTFIINDIMCTVSSKSQILACQNPEIPDFAHVEI